MATLDYKNVFRWGRKTVKRSYKDEGEIGLRKTDKAASTCRRYAKDMRLKKTKKGKPLDLQKQTVLRWHCGRYACRV